MFHLLYDSSMRLFVSLPNQQTKIMQRWLSEHRIDIQRFSIFDIPYLEQAVSHLHSYRGAGALRAARCATQLPAALSYHRGATRSLCGGMGATAGGRS